MPYVYERSALVRKKWEEARVKPSDINSLADFTERVPFITKDDIRRFRDGGQDPFGGLLCTDYADATTVFSTSGTTGDATLYAHAWDRWHPFWAATARDLWEIGVRPGDYVLGSGFKMRGPLYHADQMVGAIPVMVNTGIGGWATALDAIRRYRPVYAQLTGLALAELDHLSRTTDMRELFSSFKGAAFAGEPLGARVAGAAGKLGRGGLRVDLHRRRHRRVGMPPARRLPRLGGLRAARGRRPGRQHPGTARRWPTGNSASWSPPRWTTRSPRWCASAPTTSSG